MGFFKRLTVLLLIFIMSSSLYASGFEISGVGVKARGLAGAYRAVANDWSAAYYNPAGYAFLADNEVGSNFSLMHYRHELTPNYLFGGEYESGIYNDQVNYNDHEVLTNPSGGIVFRLPVFGESVFGLSSYNLFDNNLNWNLYDLPTVYNDLLEMPNDQFGINLDVAVFQATIAKSSANEKFAFGLGLQVLRADLVFSDIVFRENPFPSPSPLSVRPWDKVTEWYKVKGDGYGFGLNVGLMAKPSEKLSIGFNARIPFPITVTGEGNLTFFMPYIEAIDGTNDSVGIENPGAFGTAGNLFVAGQKIVDMVDYELEITLPSSFGVGLAYQVNDKMQISVDAEYVLWSQFEGFDFVFTNHSGLTGPADTTQLVNDFLTTELSKPIEYEDALKFMAGLSYDLHINDKKLFTLLGGYAMDESPAKTSEILSPQFFDTGDKTTISGGIIWHYQDQWDFGISTAYTMYPELSTSAIVDLDNDGINDNINGLYDGDSYETVLSFTYRF